MTKTALAAIQEEQDEQRRQSSKASKKAAFDEAYDEGGAAAVACSGSACSERLRRTPLPSQDQHSSASGRPCQCHCSCAKYSRCQAASHLLRAEVAELKLAAGGAKVLQDKRPGKRPRKAPEAEAEEADTFYDAMKAELETRARCRAVLHTLPPRRARLGSKQSRHD